MPGMKTIGFSRVGGLCGNETEGKLVGENRLSFK
jgi:hypothetical protein